MRKTIWLFSVLVFAVLLCFTACAKENASDAAVPGDVPSAPDTPGPSAEADDPEDAGNPEELEETENGAALPEDGADDKDAPDAPPGAEDESGAGAGLSEDGVYLPESESGDMQMEDIPETAEPAVPVVIEPAASGEIVYGNDAVTIDASHTGDGYVMIRYNEQTASRIKTLITFPDGTTYQYNLTPGAGYAAFPLSGGGGQYGVGVYKNVEGTKYTTVYTVDVYAEITDEFAPFLQPNQYVNYSAESSAVLLAAELASGLAGELEIVGEIYTYIITNISYDFDKASSVKSGYLPDIDEVLEAGKGICFDYAALMTAMLRSRGIPTKLIVGYTGDIYHAWISVYTEKSGWIDSVIFFDGTTWKLMDPTFASSGSSSEEIMAYIGNTANYAAKYLY